MNVARADALGAAVPSVSRFRGFGVPDVRFSSVVFKQTSRNVHGPNTLSEFHLVTPRDRHWMHQNRSFF
jgi:hypothetical protein|tara:strand:- start:75 stop:281 length:207 start_codon:yes stop_codon:yes gene_type:complete